MGYGSVRVYSTVEVTMQEDLTFSRETQVKSLIDRTPGQIYFGFSPVTDLGIRLA